VTTNVVQGFAAEFIADFRDTTGEPAIPSGATLSLTYPSGVSKIVQTLTMAQQQPYRFVATWYSAVSDLGLVPWSVSVSSVSSSPQAQGTIRVIKGAGTSSTSPTFLLGPDGKYLTDATGNYLLAP